jgi:hypothetical protein
LLASLWPDASIQLRAAARQPISVFHAIVDQSLAKHYSRQRPVDLLDLLE